MNYFYHSGKEAVSQCPDCGKFLCADCAQIVAGGRCVDCGRQLWFQIKSELKSIIALTIITLICAIVGLILFSSFDGFDTTTGIVGFCLLLVGGLIPAWKILTNLANKMFGVRIYEGVMIVIAFAIKLILCIFLSVFMPIVYIVKLIIKISQYNNYKKQMNLIEEFFASISNDNEEALDAEIVDSEETTN